MSDWSYEETSHKGVENEDLTRETPSPDSASDVSEASNEVEEWLGGARKENPDLPDTGAFI